MAEKEYVSREEFVALQREVEELKKDMEKNQVLLQSIDKKIDVITERITNNSKLDELKLQPVTSRVQKLEETQSWVVKTVLGTLIGIAIKIIYDISKML